MITQRQIMEAMPTMDAVGIDLPMYDCICGRVHEEDENDFPGEITTEEETDLPGIRRPSKGSGWRGQGASMNVCAMTYFGTLFIRLAYGLQDRRPEVHKEDAGARPQDGRQAFIGEAGPRGFQSLPI